MKINDLCGIVQKIKKDINNLKYVDKKIFMCSSENKSGIAKLKEHIINLINFDIQIFNNKTKRNVYFL
jgi:selenocysteine-specific translation elongation factor